MTQEETEAAKNYREWNEHYDQLVQAHADLKKELAEERLRGLELLRILTTEQVTEKVRAEVEHGIKDAAG